MPFDDEDRALTERLKKKYEGRVVDRSHEEAMNGGMGVDVAEIAAFQRKEDARRLEEMKDGGGGAATLTQAPREIEVKLCQFCQGVGSVKEHYGPRELTRHCENCDGEGTLQYGVRANKAKPVVKPMTLEINFHKRRTLHKSVDKIEGKLEKYRGEIDELVSKMHSAQVQGEEEQECLADLVNKMQAHMSGLRDKVATKRAELGKLGPGLNKPPGVHKDSVLASMYKDLDEGALQDGPAGSTPIMRTMDCEDRRMAEGDGKEEEEDDDDDEAAARVDITPPESACVTEASSPVTEASSPDSTFVTQAEPIEVESIALSEDQSAGGEQNLLAEVDAHMHLTGLLDKGNDPVLAGSGNDSLNDLD